MSSKTGNKSKSKKCIKTTLGTSKPCNINENIVDDSHVRGPIHTSIFGLREVLSLFTTATDEVLYFERRTYNITLRLYYFRYKGM